MVSKDLLIRMNKLEIINTRDGSDTIYNSDLGESYHSTFGAIQESSFIFIGQGLIPVVKTFDEGPLQILEIGFGTGLNALLTQIEAERTGRKIIYTSIEAFPLPEEIWQRLNYPRQLCSIDYTAQFHNLHQASWDQPEEISPHFTLHKLVVKLEDYAPPDDVFHGVFFDAFSPAAQPELWNELFFRKIHTAMKPDGFFVTYSVKGTVVRALKSVGFTIEKLAGPPGKRHILRAKK